MKTKLTKARFLLGNRLLLLLMRTFIFLCCLTVFGFTPNDLVSQKSSIKIDLDGAMTVDEIFDLIMNQTDYSFIYEVGMFDDYPTIPVKKGRISTNRLLKKSLEPGNLDVVLTTDNTIMVKKADSRSRRSQINVSGTVTDQEGFPLVNVTVLIKGTTKGATTDFDGNYSIIVPYPENVLQFMHMGFETQEVKVGDQATIDVVMKETAQALEEVVITAQGIKKSKKALGYAISQVKSEEVEQRPEADLARTLQGKIAGVVITPADGQTGSDSPIRIRGNVSITGSNNPLIVVNDVPFNGLLRDINPNDIESMSILKGFNASVLYGSEGRNGVILIQTKSASARTGQAKTTASYSTTVYTNTVSQLPEFQNTYSNGGEGEFQPTYLSNWGPAFSDIGTIDHPYAPLSDIFPQYEGATMNISAKPNNVRNIFRTGIGTTHSLTVATSQEKVGFNITAGYTDEKGIIDHNDLKRFNISVGGRAQISDKLDLSATLNYSSRKVNRVYGESIFNVVYYQPRWIDLTELPYQNPLTGESVYYRNDTNPLWMLHNTGTNDIVEHVYGTVNANYKLSDDFNLTYRAGYDSRHFSGFEYSNKGGYDDNTFKIGYLRLDSERDVDVNQTVILGFDKNITEDLNLEAQIGANSRITRYQSRSSDSDGQVVYGFLRPSNYVTTEAEYESEDENLAGVFGQFQFAYKRYLYATLSGRNDWGSTVEKANQSLFYPGASLSFVPTSAFDFGGNVINFLKIRGAYATSSGYPSAYRTRGTLVIDNLRFAAADGSYPVTNRYSTRYANPDLAPELHREFELGLETNMFNNRLTLEASVYKRISEDQIVGAPLAGSSGFDTQYINLGRVDNKGVEIDLGIDLFKNDNFQWNFRNIFTADESLVVRTTDTGANINLSSTDDRFAVEGQPFGVIMGDYALRDENGNLLISGNGSSTRVGEVITSSDVGFDDKVIGDSNADWRLTNINTFSYKGFRFSAQLEYRHGGEIYSSAVSSMLQRGVTRDTEDRDGAFVIPGYLADDATGAPLLDANGNEIPNTFQMNPGRISYSNYYNANDLAMWDTSIFRIREVALGYTLTTQKGQSLPFKSINFTLSGRNLWYRAPNFPRYTNYDPESDGLEGNSTVPSTRRIALGITATF